MDGVAADRDLVTSYAREGSEAAFRALVARHVNLVFAVARRQVGDSGLAEEITQNVFVALARKAPRLAGHETLAGWLHRTAVLESKARIRAELRRRRREETAIELAASDFEPAPGAADDLTPLLDEALLNLREQDRLALVLRFLEERSLREVGSILGVDEDAARKRVTRALSRVTEFFRARGFAVPAASAVVVLGQAVQAAPAGLVVAASNAGLAAGGSVGLVKLLLTQIMTLSKVQTAAVGLLLVATPLVLQQRAWSDARQRHATALDSLARRREQVAGLEAEAARLGELTLHSEAETRAAEIRLAELDARRRPAAAAPTYRWDDASPVVRIPKELLGKLSLQAVSGKRGDLTTQIKAALQLNAAETDGVQAALHRFLGRYNDLLAREARRVPPEIADLQGRKPEDVRVFAVAGIRESVAGFRDDLFHELAGWLEPERLALLIRSLDGWMPVEEEVHGFSSDLAVMQADHRVRFFRDSAVGDPDRPMLGWGVAETGRGSMTAAIALDDIPSAFRPQLQDWIDAVRAEARAEQDRRASGAAALTPRP